MNVWLGEQPPLPVPMVKVIVHGPVPLIAVLATPHAPVGVLINPGLELFAVCGAFHPLRIEIATAPPFMFPPLAPAVNVNVKLLPELPAIAVVGATAMDPSPLLSAATA